MNDEMTIAVLRAKGGTPRRTQRPSGKDPRKRYGLGPPYRGPDKVIDPYDMDHTPGYWNNDEYRTPLQGDAPYDPFGSRPLHDEDPLQRTYPRREGRYAPDTVMDFFDRIQET